MTVFIWDSDTDYWKNMDYHDLTDERIKRTIINESLNVRLYMLFQFIGTFFVANLFIKLFCITNPWLAFIVLPVAWFATGAIIKFIDVPFMQKRKRFAESNYHNARIYLSEYRGTNVDCFSEHIRFFINFLTAGGHPRANEIDEDTYDKLNAYSFIAEVYVLEYPLLHGHGYMAFAPQYLNNKSSIEISDI